MPLDLTDAAEMLGVSPETLRRWARQGRLGVRRPSGEFRFQPEELRRWARAQGLKVPRDGRTHRRPCVVDPDTFPLSTAIDRGGILADVAGDSVEAVLADLVQRATLPDACSREDLLQKLLDREAMGSTGLAPGVALPHPRTPSREIVEHPTVFLAQLQAPVDWNAADGHPVHSVILLLNPTPQEHLQVLSRLAVVMREAAFTRALEEQAEGEALRRLVNRLEGKSVE